MKRISFIAVILVSCCLLYGQENKINYQCLDSVPGWLRENKVPSVAIAFLENGKLTEAKVYGELKKGITAPPDAIYNVASLTKPVTAILTLMLVNAGKWKLDEPLYHYWTDPDIKEDPRNKQLTTRIVLSHRTGFLNWRWNNGNTRLAFQFDPGTKYQYSGEGFEYLRKSLERKFGQSLEKLARKYLFEPLTMTDTRFTWDTAFENKFAGWHDRNGENSYETRKRDDICAADDLMCTINDYGKFAQFVLNRAGLSPTLFNEMSATQVKVGEHLTYGLGWLVVRDLPADEYAIVHSGADIGVRAIIILLPKSKRGVIVFTNGDNGQKIIKDIVAAALDCGPMLIKYMSQ